VYVVLSNPPPYRKNIEEVKNGAITGTEGVFEFTNQYGVPALGSMNLSEDEIIDVMKKYLQACVKFENEWSIRRNKPPMTDNRINILVVRASDIEYTYSGLYICLCNNTKNFSRVILQFQRKQFMLLINSNAKI